MINLEYLNTKKPIKIEIPFSVVRVLFNQGNISEEEFIKYVLDPTG